MVSKAFKVAERVEGWAVRHIIGILSTAAILGVGALFHYLDWWNAIGLLILNLGLGVKLHGAKTFAVAVAKAGGKKALAMTTVGVLLKRLIIDKIGKFFAEHSVKRYKNNLVRFAKLKFKHMKESTPAQKIKAAFSTLLSVPLVYFFWTKVLGTAIQKFIYALVYPIIASIFQVLTYGLNFITGLVTFIFQLTVLNYFITWLEKYTVGRLLMQGIVGLFRLIGGGFNTMNLGFKRIGLDPKHRLTVWSIKFNRWLEKKLHKEMNARDAILNRRELHVNSRELLLIKRDGYANKIPEVSIKKKAKKFFDKKVLKKKDWREKREERERLRAEKRGERL